VNTIDYPWYHPPFPEYNEAQTAVIPFIDKDLNLVISFATAVGKTVLAECCFGYHLANREECRVAYICPFKSLASEKFKSWTDEPQLGQYGVVLWSSDSNDDRRDGRLIVSTLESFDMKTRSKGWDDWISSFDVVVFDEAHIIGDESRGGAMEAAAIRLADKNPKARIVFLSATMGNAGDLAKWVKTLNGKNTKCITSSWRPTKVRTEYHIVDGHDEKTAKAVELATQSAFQKTLVFVHSKVTGGKIVKSLRSSGVRSVFHNASLSAAKRRKIEEAFNNPTSGLNVCVSTSTLGAGVNAGG
jgi:replicative superfamily II helicase